jgi:hypothetical protein
MKVETRTEHIRHIRLQGDFNNNKMERMNGEIRDRERVMRGLEKKDTPILTGYQLFHNYTSTHGSQRENTGRSRGNSRKWRQQVANINSKCFSEELKEVRD